MADIDLQDINNSGDVTGLNIGGVASSDKVLKKSELDATYQVIAGSSAITKTKYTPQSSPPSHVEGQEYYDANHGNKMIQSGIPGVEVAVGHSLHMHVENNSGGLIEKGMAVRQNGVVDGKVQITKALADTFTNARILGIVSEDIADGDEGAITTFGEISDLDTSTLPTGVPLFLSDTVAGTYTSTAPAIISRIGGAIVSDAAGAITVYIINNKNTPTVFGGMQGQSGTGVYSLTTTAQDIDDYDTSSTIVMTVDKPNGTITLSNDGEYRMHFAAAISFTSLTSTRSVTFEFYDVTGTTIHFSYVKNIPRDATEDSLSFSWPIGEVADNVHKVRIKASTTMDVTFNEISFDIQSVNITS